MKQTHKYTKPLHFYGLILVILTLFACEKDADIKLEEMPPSLVVESIFCDQPDESFVRLSQSEGFETSGNYENITDAQVLIKDEQGNQINFQVDADGIYKTTGIALENKTYQLEITKNTKRITATKTMLPKVVLQDFDLILNQNTYHSKIALFFDDPSPEKNYFKIEIYNVDQNFPDEKMLIVQRFFNDYTYNAQTHKIELPNMPYASGTYRVALFHIDKNTYDYFKTLKSIGNMRYGSSPFISSVPGNPESTIQGGIGYFFTAGISSKQKTFQ